MEIDEVLSNLWKQEPKLWNEKTIQYRSELGDTLDLFILRNLQNHILLYDPAILSVVYNSLFNKIKNEVGDWKNNVGLDNYFSDDFDRLSVNEKENLLRIIVEEHLGAITKKFGWGLPRLNRIDLDNEVLEIQVKECAEAHGSSIIGHPICFNMAAILGGMIGGWFDGWRCFEKECKSTGADKCTFILAPQEKINEEIREFLDLPSRVSFTLGGKITSMISEFKREIDYSTILEESTNRLAQILPDMKSEGRSNLGNEISIKGFQQFYLSFLLEDHERGSDTLYRAGEISGKRFSRILSAMGMRHADKIDVLPRFFDRLGIGLLSFKEIENGYEARVKECGYCYNLDLDEKICYFNSGFFAGFISRIKEPNFVSEEKNCCSESGKFCVHEITELNEEGEGD